MIQKHQQGAQIQRSAPYSLARTEWERWLIKSACRRVPLTWFWGELALGILGTLACLYFGYFSGEQFLLWYTVPMVLACLMVCFYRACGLLLLYPGRPAAEQERLEGYLWRTRNYGRNTRIPLILTVLGLVLIIAPLFFLPLSPVMGALFLAGGIFWIVGMPTNLRQTYLRILAREEESR